MRIFKVIRKALAPAVGDFLKKFTKDLRFSAFLSGLLGQREVGKRTNISRVKQIYLELIQSKFYQSDDKLEIENIFLTQAGVVIFYHFFQNEKIEVLAMLFETAHPRNLLWQQPKLVYEFVDDNDQWQFISLEKINAKLIAKWHSAKLGLVVKSYPKYRFERQIEVKHPIPLLTKHQHHNPMIKPQHKNHWEAFTTFNPAAFVAVDKVHILYRAQGYDYVSQVGYAVSSDGFRIDKRFSQPVYKPSQKFEGVSLPVGDLNNPFVSGGGCGGVEDPRTTVIDDRVYMTYVAYDGWSPPRVALTSISLKNFLNNNFLWEKPVLISPPGVVDKSAVIFPEKINGKYVIMHRVFPDILLDYVDSLADFDGRKFIYGQNKISPRSKEWWDSRKIGAGAPPLKTEEGWLLIYQAVDDKDASEYKVGAMLLDLNDPTKVLARSSEPILLPREEYENVGFKAGVVYPCGAVIKDRTLFVYYGGADSYVCVATADLPDFINKLKKTGNTDLNSVLLAVEQESSNE
ncbi:MAG: hypothetical protein ACOZAK_01525 [Patescibacteria group bacterium]